MRLLKGGERTLDGLKFDRFPGDGRLWWLRWIDYGGSGGLTASSYLDLVFSPLPIGTTRESLGEITLDQRLASARLPSVHAIAHVGFLPVLSIGLVAQDGSVVGQLGRIQRSFVFDASTHRSDVEDLLPRSPTTLPIGSRSGRRGTRSAISTRSPGNRPGLLGALSYPLWLDKGSLLSIASRADMAGAAHLIVPCAEVCRVMYAPHTALARAILDRGWGRAKDDVLVADGTFATADGWRVATLAPLREEHVAIAGNLSINPTASRAASAIRTGIVTPEGHGPISAGFPFDWDVIEITVACLEMPRPESPAMCFGYEILEVRWPDPPLGPPALVEWIPNARPPHAPAPGADGDPLPPGPPMTKPPTGSVVEVTSSCDPAPGPAVDVVRPGATWRNKPRIVRMRPDRDEPGADPLSAPGGEQEADSVSGGGAGRDRRVSRADPQLVEPATEPLPPLFQAVQTMLTGMVADGTLSSHDAVDPPASALLKRGELRVWAFPPVDALKKGSDDRRRRWYVRDFAKPGSSRPVVRRAAFVSRIVRIRDRGAAYLIVTESSARESARDVNYRSLAFVPSGAFHVHAVLDELLRIAAERAGRWPDRDELAGLVTLDDQPGLASAAPWRHSWTSTPGGGSPPVMAGAPFRRALGRLEYDFPSD